MARMAFVGAVAEAEAEAEAAAAAAGAGDSCDRGAGRSSTRATVLNGSDGRPGSLAPKPCSQFAEYQ